MNLQLFPVRTDTVMLGADLVETVLDSLKKEQLRLEDNDVLALASKIVSFSQGRVVKLSQVRPSMKARKLAEKYLLEPEFSEIVVREADRIYGGVERAVLTLKENVLTANAGIDNKNAPPGMVVLWPEDLCEWLRNFRAQIKLRTGKSIGVMVVDSGLIPLRIGTVGFALAVAGFKPIREWRGKPDLYGRTIKITRHAVGDDLASAVHMLMGEATEKTPIVLVKNAPIEFDEETHCSEEMMMPLKNCIFMSGYEGRKGKKRKVGSRN